MARKKKIKWKKLFSITPLFFIVMIFYDILILLPGDIIDLLSKQLWSIPLPSGEIWKFYVQDVFLIFALIILFFEIVKSTHTRMGTTYEHIFSMFVFIAFLVQFLLIPGAGTSLFFVLMLFSLLDVIGGFTITIRGARRDVSYGG